MIASYEVTAALLKQKFIDEGHQDWLCRECNEPIAKHPTLAMIAYGLCMNCITQKTRLRLLEKLRMA